MVAEYNCAAETAVQPREAVVYIVTLTLIYVGMLFLPFNAGDRNAPRVLQARLASSLAFAALSEAYIRRRVPILSAFSQRRTAAYSCYLSNFATGIVLTSLLYSGPLIAQGTTSTAGPLMGRFFPETSRWHTHMRDILLAPFAEELVFRRHALLAWRCFSISAQLLGPATVFALAHLHHIRTVGAAGAILQLSYTFVFGIYAASLFLRTGAWSIAAPLGAHMLCNLLGLPDFEAIAGHPKRRFLAAIYACCIIACVSILAFCPSCLYVCS